MFSLTGAVYWNIHTYYQDYGDHNRQSYFGRYITHML
jgi:hypothetical protein